MMTQTLYPLRRAKRMKRNFGAPVRNDGIQKEGDYGAHVRIASPRIESTHKEIARLEDARLAKVKQSMSKLAWIGRKKDAFTTAVEGAVGNLGLGTPVKDYIPTHSPDDSRQFARYCIRMMKKRNKGTGPSLPVTVS